MPDLAYVCSFSSWTQTIILQLRCSAPQYQPRKASGAGCLSRWRHLNRDLLMLTNKNLHKYVLDMHFLECGTIKPNRVRNPSCLFGSQTQLVVTTFDGCSSICQTNLNSFQSDSIKVQLWNRFLFVFYGPPSRRKRCEVWHGRSGVWRERCGAIYYNQKEQKLTWEKNPTCIPTSHPWILSVTRIPFHGNVFWLGEKLLIMNQRIVTLCRNAEEWWGAKWEEAKWIMHVSCTSTFSSLLGAIWLVIKFTGW